MGYSTSFDGELKFTKELTASQLAKVKTFLGEDCRDHDEWEGAAGMTYIDLELTDDFSGLKWDGGEKTYQLTEKVNLVIREMQKVYPDFGLEGSLIAKGESRDDRWVLLIENGIAVEKEYAPIGGEIQCPHCGEYFVPTPKNKKK